MSLSLGIYQLLLPVYVIAAFPGWLWKTARRGGLGGGLMERGSFYRSETEFEPAGAIHVHAVSVGEVLLALKLIRGWRGRRPDAVFVLAVGTVTGRAVAEEAAVEGVRVTYVPVDFGWMVMRYLNRFEPSQLVLVEGEMWPNLMKECGRRGIPVSLVNARMSPRSQRRYRKFAAWVRPVFQGLDLVAVQEAEDAAIWADLGVDTAKVVVTGSMKFDPGAAAAAEGREEFREMIAACAAGRAVVLSASTHGGEEAMIAAAVADSGAFHLCVPRHAERRWEVKAELEAMGFEVILRSRFRPPETKGEVCLVVDSTGELRDWTMLADVVVIGKSFLGTGGQSPVEAILAGRPLVMGPHMENFQPLAGSLIREGAATLARDRSGVSEALKDVLENPEMAAAGAARARELLERHAGAVERTIGLLEEQRVES